MKVSHICSVEGGGGGRDSGRVRDWGGGHLVPTMPGGF